MVVVFALLVCLCSNGIVWAEQQQETMSYIQQHIDCPFISIFSDFCNNSDTSIQQNM